ncbi:MULTISPECIES: Fe-S cluster assembly protein SufD [Nitrospirillum]|uniref:Iron-regulated ABC transporter permease protein SufD n=1 Tax=Nitrospirillum amazonense TaxID=28077 RepID=A0A560G9J5_9PROT|nr:Fe-S cluster assembly protein SufD [Nitrospirillum amazonense]MEC4591718.1 Fe-S cluster assembly protein SufD [Nitrospirillum amazonense]TWB30573.1 iron-regulated ABC transporter permease protein SufD [Nitrospirillum amazonense]
MLMTDDSAPFRDAFDQVLATVAEPAWLTTRRRVAMDRFALLGFPTRRQEAWRFTDLEPLITAPPLPAPPLPATGGGDGPAPASLAPWLLPVPTHRLVLVDGRFAPALSAGGALPTGVWLASAAETLRRRPDMLERAFGEGEEAFAALNAALFTDGVVLALEPGVALETPVEIIHHTTSAAHARLHIALGAGAQATVVETAMGTGGGWGNTVGVITLGAGATLTHLHIQAEDPAACHTAAVRAVLADQARYEACALITGGRLSRRDVAVTLAGDGAQFRLHGAYLLDGGQEATLSVRADHLGLGCRTEEVVKGVLAGASHGVFLGTVAVAPGADGTDARQLNRNLLLSPQARVDTKPELEILADDVKCSHGATVGSLDEASLFYLQARGIDPDTARRMLVEAFAIDAIDAAGLPDALAVLARRHLRRWLDGGAS